jgi:pentatricopeptide repeat protein
MLLVKVYKLAGDVSSALSVLDEVEERFRRQQQQDPLHRREQKSWTPSEPPDTFLYNNVLDCCAKVGASARAVTVFERMRAAGVQRDRASYGSLLEAYRATGDWQAAHTALRTMRDVDDLKPDTRCFTRYI